MAVAYTSYGRLPPLIAVDTGRFASVGAWVSENSSMPLSSVLRRLDDRVAPVTANGTLLRLHIDLLKHPPGPLHLAVSIALPNHSQAVRTVAPVRPGTHTYYVSLPSSCASGCRITALGLKVLTAAEEGEVTARIAAAVRSNGG